MMKITIEEFRRVIVACERISSDKGAPVFRNIKLSASNGVLTASSSNADYWLTLTAQCEGDFGECLAPADKLLEAAAKLNADTIDIQSSDGALTIKAGRSRRKIQTESAAHWIEAPEANADPVSISAATLIAGFDLCQPFASTEFLTRGNLCGVNMNTRDGRLYFAATDGNAAVEYDAGKMDIELDATAPSGLAMEIVKLGLTGELQIAIGERKIVVNWDGGELVSPVIDGKFVEYRRIISADSGNTLTVNADEIASAIRGVSGFGLKDGRFGSAVAFEASGEELAIMCRSSTGEATDTVPCAIAGDIPRLGLSSVYMAKACKFFADGDMIIDAVDASKPIKITSGHHSDRLAMIMPRSV